MKRSIGSEHSLRELKRANSSLFSIATIVEQDAADGDSAGGRRSRAISIDLTKIGLGGQHRPPNALLKQRDEGREEEDFAPAVAALPSCYAGSSSPSQASTSPTVTATEASDRSAVSSSSLDDFCFIDDNGSDDEETQRRRVTVSVDVKEDDIGVPKLSPRSFLPTCAIAKAAPIVPIAPKRAATPAEPRMEPQAGGIPVVKAKTRKAPRDGDHRTGVVFEAGERHFDRYSRLHKERPLRVTSVRDSLTKSSQEFKERCCVFGQFEDDAGDDGPSSSPERKFLDDDDYLRVHVPGYMQRLDRLSTCSCTDRLDREAEQYKSIYFTPDTVEEAKTAATSLCRLVSDVTSGSIDNGFAVIRPPGHHAEPGLAGGYCVVNNVAVAAAYARAKLGMNRVLIVDWDVHHGNGTQSIFLDDPNVLYFSAHRYHGGNFFPFLEDGGPNTVGRGDGAGFNINVGWNKKGMGDDEYVAVWEKVLMPVAEEFRPDLVLVSAGFDAAEGDLGECNITPACFARLTRRLMTLAAGRVVCALEGGYVRSVLSRCVESVVGALLDKNSVKKSAEEVEKTRKIVAGGDILDFVDDSAAKSIRKTITAHKQFWSCCFGDQALKN
mmetsp:Transcript_4091/g.11248  ORF Transcript_4091/g.11248 Transcript_4091/m.11248 type:complete len:608 (-) Transcript_4091:407-2230(-)